MATIITKHEDGDATDAPLSLAYGELAVNTQAGKLWVGNSATTPINILGAIIPTGSVDGATLRWEAATTKWEQSSALKITDAGNVVATGSVTAASFSGTLQWSDVATTPTTLAGYGIADAATSAQGALANTATQPGDNVSTLTNDSGYYVNGAAGFTSTGIDDNAPATAVTIDSSGNVGIGAASPAAKLDVNGSIQAVSTTGTKIAFGATTFVSGSSTIADYGITYNDEGASFDTNLAGFSNMKFHTNRTERLRISPNGNVGIGTASPATALDVNGTVTTDGLALSGRVTEEVFAVTGTTPALDPQNGTVQTWTLSGNSAPTFAAGFTTGASMTLMIDDGAAYSITWPTTQWAGGSAPTLATTGYTVVELWRVGATYYGALVGEMS